MILYSIVPYDAVMGGTSLPQNEWIARDGRFFEITRQSGGQVISRLFSTDPMDYLDPRFAPGERL